MKKVFTLLIALLFLKTGFAQDAYLTNPAHSLVYLNPSFSGSNGFIRNQTAYREQWSNLNRSFYSSFLNSFDAYIKPIKGGISFTALLDDQNLGTLTTNWYSVAYAQHFFLFDKKLKIVPSIQATYFEEKLDKTKLNFGDPFNSRYNDAWLNSALVPQVSKSNFDLSSGLMFQYNAWTFGASVFHIVQPNISLNGDHRLPPKITLHASRIYQADPRQYINLSTFTNIQSGNIHSQINNIVHTKRFIYGFGYFYEKSNYLSIMSSEKREYHNLIFNAGLRIKWISLAYTYDITIFTSNKSLTNKGSHMLSMNLHFKNKKNPDEEGFRQDL